jgi:hypothetical protein
LQPTSEEEKMLFVSDEHYKREKNAFCLAKWAIEAELNKKKKKPKKIIGASILSPPMKHALFLGNETFRLI